MNNPGEAVQPKIPIGGFYDADYSTKQLAIVLTHLQDGKIDDAIAGFSEEFRFEDHGIGVEFTDKERLAEFFQKTRELYPDSTLQTDTIFLSGDHVIMEWTLQSTLTEPFYGGLSRKVRVSLHGASIVRTDDGRLPSGRTTMTD